jgi:aminopeptidase N
MIFSRTLCFLACLFAMTFHTNISAQDPPKIEPGVSRELARWRAAHYSDIRYKLDITLEKGAPLMKGTIEIRVNLTDEGAKNDLVLDWRTTQFDGDKAKPYANVIAVNGTGAQTARLPEREARKEMPQFQSTSDKNETTSRLPSNLASGPLALRSEELAFHSNEHLIIPSKFLKTGENVIKIEFASPIKTSGAAVTRYVDKTDGAEYIYTLFVPSDASTAFPVFDQPDLKARFQLGIRPPDRWKVVSNTAVKSRKRMDPMDWGHFSFEETKPISTYVFAFAAGEFAEFDENGSPRVSKGGNDTPANDSALTNVRASASMPDSKIYVRRSQAEKFKQHAEEVFRLNREGVKFLESWFDYPFPFPKYDLILIPEFPFGGMEHAGATFLREDRVIFPTEPTKNDYITRANVIFHEAAHQWFGDTVTMQWFDDLWLKEGFAEFMAYKTLEKLMPEMNAWKVFYERNKQAAYLTDVTKGTTPIYQEIPNLSAAKSAYGNIVYRKAPSFLKQAEFYLGEKEFQTAVRAFLKKHEFANATWQDLVNEFGEVEVSNLRNRGYYQKTYSDTERKSAESYTKKTTRDWANFWVKTRGAFKFYLETKPFGGDEVNGEIMPIGGYLINPTYRTEFPENNNSSPLSKFKALIIYKDGTRSVKDFEVASEKIPVPEVLVEKEIAAIIPNYQDYGYGIFLLDEKSREYVLKNIQNEKDDFLRSMMWGALWDSVRFFELAPEEYVKLVVKNISVEQDESTIQTLLSRVSTAMNYYLTDEQAKSLAPGVEKLLIEKVETASGIGQKITYFRALQSIGSSERTKQIFKDLLNGRSNLKNVELKTKDKFDLVTRLIILGDRDGLKMLDALEKTETSDEAKRYAYAARAGVPTAESKAKYWNDFVNNKDLSENWIESAFAVFNTPRHAELTLPYLEKALAELPKLKRDRKIFFVNGWLAAFIGGQKSEEALNAVNKFLAENPNLDADLQRKILENADNLERAVKIRAKFGR